MASWDSKESFDCALQNPVGSSRSSWYILPIVFHIPCIQTYYSFDILFPYTKNSDILLFQHTAFCILWIRTYNFSILFCTLWIRTYYSFDILFFAYYEFGHTTLLTYCFSHTINSDILLFWHTVFRILWIQTYYSWHTVFRILWIQTYYSFDILFFAYYEFGHTTLLICCFSHTMNSEILFWHTVFHILYSREVFDFGCSKSLNAWQLYPKIQARNALLIHKHFLFIGKCIGIWYSTVYFYSFW